MAQDDATFGASREEPTPTPEAAPPIPADFMSSIMARFARQDEVQKMTNEQLAALVAPLTAPDGQTSRPQLIHHRLFNTNPTATGGDHASDDMPLATRTTVRTVLCISSMRTTYQPRPWWSEEKDRTSGSGNLTRPTSQLMLSAQPNLTKQRVLPEPLISPRIANITLSLVSRQGRLQSQASKSQAQKWQKLEKNKERRAQRKAIGKGRQNEKRTQDEDKALKDDGNDDSSADEEQPTNRRCVEVILSQHALSSDEENDDTPSSGDFRDVLKRKLEPEDNNNLIDNDLRLTLNARKSRRVLTSNPVPEPRPKHLGSDLRDKLNADICDIRVLLNRSKPTDLRRQTVIASSDSRTANRRYADTHIPLFSYVLIRHLAEGPIGHTSPMLQTH
ncbi:hypothetical protein F2Q68_00011461 [Brassica cretica]|uniref:Uncharacterized protein n=1 Tax=Brassica cretica TaxID=69181 RepID=A0A8S9KS86_BRACR|nr:hypothetical protein F2Q68_00011461 [Brassica cretica]